ncbi:Abi family protein [Bacillus cereus]|uniref:Abi family protein n=1 Tax=Bacillus cereus TaxID=1396 RepID=UPI000BF8D0D7|nr:Abi family protein [Bacillus cereus]PEW14654.1 hypothetical protein CN440_03210 [Bacillus cereus]
MSVTALSPAPNPKEKRKVTFDEMITHLEGKNILFNIISKEEAKNILEYSNYMYKVTAYRKNFYQDRAGNYRDLEFGMLNDLATIDMRLRYLVLQMSLDIEHSLKTKILADITNDPNEDGYSIVKDFLHHDNSCIDDYMHPMSRQSHYNYGLYTKHHNNPPVWVLFEVITFGTFVKFVEFYYLYKGKSRKYEDLYKILRYVKNIRNSAAHNNPMLIDIISKQLNVPITFPITSFVKKIRTISNDVRRKRLSNRKVHDLTALFYVYDKYITSEPMKKIRYNDLNSLLNRCLRYKEHYSKHDGLVSIYKYFSKIIDFLNNRV